MTTIVYYKKKYCRIIDHEVLCLNFALKYRRKLMQLKDRAGQIAKCKASVLHRSLPLRMKRYESFLRSFLLADSCSLFSSLQTRKKRLSLCSLLKRQLQIRVTQKQKLLLRLKNYEFSYLLKVFQDLLALSVFYHIYTVSIHDCTELSRQLLQIRQIEI